MKLKPLGLILASIVLVWLFYGCEGITESARAASNEGTGHSPDNKCTWHFTRDPQNHKVNGPIVLDKNQGGVCSVVPPSGQLFIGSTPTGGKRVLDIGAIEFKLEGSCLYCYTDTYGGMSCVSYAGPPC